MLKKEGCSHSDFNLSTSQSEKNFIIAMNK